uniref:Uncharacterized protein n=1 Tax=Otus sunia TaxID=257818 RepID=A0A8C8AE16_9STRI
MYTLTRGPSKLATQRRTGTGDGTRGEFGEVGGGGHRPAPLPPSTPPSPLRSDAPPPPAG